MTSAAPTEEKKLTNPHDRFFKQILSRPELATDLIRYYLPADIVTLLDLTTVQIAKDSFVDKELQTHFSDLLYQVQTNDGNPAYVYTLFDHKSYSDSDVAFQLLRYQARIWEQLPRLEQNKLPPIFPVVFYHGVSKWTVAPTFGALFPEKTPPSFPFCQISSIILLISRVIAMMRFGAQFSCGLRFCFLNMYCVRICVNTCRRS